MINKENMYNNMLRMVEVPGVSGTESEKMTAYKVEELLREIPYFQGHPENVKLIPLVDDPFERSIVTAFMELNPGCPDTVILTGHYDVVDVEEFGHLQDIAYNVEEITKRINEMPLDEDSQKDFESGEWIFGRGTADMKYGHALCMELMKHYSEEKSIKGNLLYVAVCGEETNSEGMLRAVPFFNQLAEEKGLKYRALLLTECYMMEDQAGDNNRYIHYGASGKIMPMDRAKASICSKKLLGWEAQPGTRMARTHFPRKGAKPELVNRSLTSMIIRGFRRSGLSEPYFNMASA